jgi:hypothetical protein
MEHRSACDHLTERPDLEILWTLDAYLHTADAYAKCKHCDAHYLVEMIDLDSRAAVFRVARLPADYVAKTVRSLEKGSCDINRARNEAFALRNAAERLPMLLIMRQGRFVATVPVGGDVEIPQESWRDLPCDGTWLTYADRERER